MVFLDDEDDVVDRPRGLWVTPLAGAWRRFHASPFPSGDHRPTPSQSFDVPRRFNQAISRNLSTRAAAEVLMW
jgi:hypothetical protein